MKPQEPKSLDDAGVDARSEVAGSYPLLGFWLRSISTNPHATVVICTLVIVYLSVRGQGEHPSDAPYWFGLVAILAYSMLTALSGWLDLRRDEKAHRTKAKAIRKRARRTRKE